MSDALRDPRAILAELRHASYDGHNDLQARAAEALSNALDALDDADWLNGRLLRALRAIVNHAEADIDHPAYADTPDYWCGLGVAANIASEAIASIAADSK